MSVIGGFNIYSNIISCLFHRGGLGGHEGHMGENGTVSGKSCPKGLYGIFCEVVHDLFIVCILKYNFFSNLLLV